MKPNPKAKRLLPERFKPSANAVIIGKGKMPKEATGNIRLRGYVESKLQDYAQAKCRKHRAVVVANVIDKVKSACAEKEGMFVKFEKQRWWEVGEGLAREKVSAMFRDYLHYKYKSSTKYKVAKRRARNLVMNGNTDNDDEKKTSDVSVADVTTSTAVSATATTATSLSASNVAAAAAVVQQQIRHLQQQQACAINSMLQPYLSFPPVLQPPRGIHVPTFGQYPPSYHPAFSPNQMMNHTNSMSPPALNSANMMMMNKTTTMQGQQNVQTNGALAPTSAPSGRTATTADSNSADAVTSQYLLQQQQGGERRRQQAMPSLAQEESQLMQQHITHEGSAGVLPLDVAEQQQLMQQQQQQQQQQQFTVEPSPFEPQVLRAQEMISMNSSLPHDSNTRNTLSGTAHGGTIPDTQPSTIRPPPCWGQQNMSNTSSATIIRQQANSARYHVTPFTEQCDDGDDDDQDGISTNKVTNDMSLEPVDPTMFDCIPPPETEAATDVSIISMGISGDTTSTPIITASKDHHQWYHTASSNPMISSSNTEEAVLPGPSCWDW